MRYRVISNVSLDCCVGLNDIEFECITTEDSKHCIIFGLSFKSREYNIRIKINIYSWNRCTDCVCNREAFGMDWVHRFCTFGHNSY